VNKIFDMKGKMKREKVNPNSCIFFTYSINIYIISNLIFSFLKGILSNLILQAKLH